MELLRKNRDIYTKSAMIGLYILYNIMPIIPRVISSTVTTYSYMLLVLFVALFIVSSDVNYYLTIVFPFAVFDFMTILLSNNGFGIKMYQFILFLMPVLLGAYILRNYEYNTNLFAKLIIVAFVITMITTSIGLVQYPSASRVLATVDSSQNDFAILYSWHNMGGYDLVYTVVLLYPLLIIAYKKKLIKLPIAIFSSIGMLLFLISASYTTALLLFAISSILYFMSKEFRIQNLFFLVVFSFITIILFQGKMAEILLWLSEQIGNADISKRLALMAGGTSAINKSDDNRLLLFQQSLDVFFKHPIFGGLISGDTGIGGHSFVFDTLGHFGLIGIVLLCVMYKKIYRLFYSMHSKDDEFGYIIWIFLQAIVLSCLNTGMWMNVICLFAPLLLKVMSSIENNKK